MSEPLSALPPESQSSVFLAVAQSTTDDISGHVKVTFSSRSRTLSSGTASTTVDTRKASGDDLTCDPEDLDEFNLNYDAECLDDNHHDHPLFRVNTLGDLSKESARNTFCRQVSLDPEFEPIDDGQTGDVFALCSPSGEKVAVFKPSGREHFNRHSLTPGQGAVREEAAYVVDRLSGGTAGLPVTTCTALEVSPGAVESGSLQAFAHGHIGPVEDFAMPRSYAAAIQFVSAETAESVAILDMRLFNTDRHGGNLLLTKPPEEGSTHGLVPIDHGCCLPPWWSLDEACFQAWKGWPQLCAMPSAHAKATMAKAVESLPATVQALRQLGIESASLITLQLSTLFLEVGVLERCLPLDTLAGLLLRNDESNFEEPSWFEQHVSCSITAAGVPCHFAVSMLNVKSLVTDDGRDFAEAAGSLDVTLLLKLVRESLMEALPHQP
eukprot:TRINITY_DN33653_c0_g1_i1.p1 TRINITY_DN33653_c0_g1~~TRINITY_DN33653_c0_g1_i1.p1  ORF type:complete len:438 (+),score=77.91 TRINITY_DN33653_c0_g1_i1:50-1363(+)